MKFSVVVEKGFASFIELKVKKGLTHFSCISLMIFRTEPNVVESFMGFLGYRKIPHRLLKGLYMNSVY